METQIDKPWIVNQALVIDLGQPAAFSIDGTSRLGAIVDLVWQTIVDRTFGLHDWTFCRRTKKLDRHVDQPVTGWRFAFDLPGDKVGDPLGIFRDRRCRQPLRDFYLEGIEVHCDEAEIYARCRVLVDPRYWDPAFRAAFRKALAAELAVPILSDVELREQLRREAFGTPSEGGTGGEFGRLIAQNRAASPVGAPFPGAEDPLVSARWG